MELRPKRLGHHFSLIDILHADLFRITLPTWNFNPYEYSTAEIRGSTQPLVHSAHIQILHNIILLAFVSRFLSAITLIQIFPDVIADLLNDMQTPL
jgi:hypothetical protein